MKKSYLASAAALTLAVVVLSAFVGCCQHSGVCTLAGNADSVTVSSDPALVGKWVAEGERGILFSSNMDLLKDGTGIRNYDIFGMGAKISWKAENGRFYLYTTVLDMNGETVAMVWDYKISGTTLTLTSGNEQIATYTKVAPSLRPGPETDILSPPPPPSPAIQYRERVVNQATNSHGS